MFKTILNKIKSIKGNSLAEFAVTTAMMATLAATAAPQFGSVGEGAKEKKTMNNIDKIIQSANNYYNAKLDEEGRGRFPGQSKYDLKVGGYDLPANTDTDLALEMFVETVLNNYDGYTDDLSAFVYVFATAAVKEAGKTLPNGLNAHATVRPQEWWNELFTPYKNYTLDFTTKKPTKKKKY